MQDKAKRLARVLRVRTLQLAHAVAPVATPAASAQSLGAAAHYRDRLHASVDIADRRVAQADDGLVRAKSATLEARRDQSAIEKLIARADAAQGLRDLRAMENAPPVRKPNRHDPC